MTLQPFAPPAAAAGTVANPWLPADDGLVAASWDPVAGSSTGGVPGGMVLLIRIPIRVTVTAANLVVMLTTPAAASTSTGTFAGLYLVNGTSLTRLTGSADMGATLATAATGNAKGIALPFSVPQSLTAGQVVYGALLVNMTSGPTFANLSNRGQGNAGVNQAWPRTCDYPNGGAGSTALPASGVITSSNIDVATFSSPLWMGLS
jgi:hypothetical protein